VVNSGNIRQANSGGWQSASRLALSVPGRAKGKGPAVGSTPEIPGKPGLSRVKDDSGSLMSFYCP
jgi:hypothetical protein